jgi:hypothetical protein
MTLKRRIERLTEKAPPPANERPTEIFLVGICPETQEAIFAYGMYSGQSLERITDETEFEFRIRINQCG